MARPPRKRFDQLSDSQQQRKLSWFRRHEGLSASEVKRRYNAGELSQKGSRGHKSAEESRKSSNPSIKVIVRHGDTSAVVIGEKLTKSERSLVGYHWWAVQQYIEGQKSADWLETRMRRFEKRTVGSNRLHFETRTEGFELLAHHGELNFEDIYPSTEDEEAA